MTKEEAIEHLKLIRLNAGMTGAESFKEALDLAIVSLSQPSLPSGLDDAAEAHRRKVYCGDAEMCQFVREVFKSGAEWMAGQGASYNTKVGWIDGPTVLDWPDDILDKFGMGDEVIVQIRKKQ